jgi:glycosyltransferase involved in cell wall biosynthesis
VVIARNDEDIISRCVGSVVSQKCPRPFETIVVTSGSDRTAQIVREQFPQVTVLELPRPAFPGEARNAGLGVARGEYVAFPDSHIELPPESLAARLTAHDEMDYAIVLGATVNGTRTWAGWGSYFLDHFDVLPGGSGREQRRAPSQGASCSYLRAALEMVGGFREDMRAGEDTVLNQKLARMGYVTYREPEARIIHHSRCRTPRYLARHHFIRGQWMGRILLGRHGGQGRLAAAIRPWFGFGHVPRRLSMIRERVMESPRSLRFQYRLALPMIVLGAVAFWLGVWYELLRPGPKKFATLWGAGAPDVYRDPSRW